MQIKPLRRSACVGLYRVVGGRVCYLVQTRKTGMTYSGSYTFCGGTLDPSDYQLCPRSSWHEVAKFTALRETFQEVGLLLVPNSLPDQSLLSLSQKDVPAFIAARFQELSPHLHCVMRCLSDHYTAERSRYDTIYFIVGEGLRAVNLRQYLKSGKKEGLMDMQELVIQQEQMKEAKWVQPGEWLDSMRQGQRDIYMTMVAMCVAIRGCTTIEQVHQQVKLISKLEDHYFPYMYQFDGDLWRMPPDRFYDREKQLREEPQSASRQDMEEWFKRVPPGQILEASFWLRDGAMRMSQTVAMSHRSIFELITVRNPFL